MSEENKNIETQNSDFYFEKILNDFSDIKIDKKDQDQSQLVILDEKFEYGVSRDYYRNKFPGFAEDGWNILDILMRN